MKRDEAIRTQLHSEVQKLNVRLAMDDPEKMKLIEHRQDEFKSFVKTRDIAERHFVNLKEKYGEIQPRGPETLSIRTIPQLSLDNTSPPVVFRLLVPTKREVWLKYAVAESGSRNRIPSKLDQLGRLDPPPTDTGFRHNGYYEIKLRQGERVFEVHCGKVIGAVLPIEVRLDGEKLLTTQFSADGVPHTGSFHISSRKQIDYPMKRELPWLLNINVRVRRDGGPSKEAAHAGCFWLSDRSSGLESFPELGDAQ